VLFVKAEVEDDRIEIAKDTANNGPSWHQRERSRICGAREMNV
jgi:hypothetical protein